MTHKILIITRNNLGYEFWNRYTPNSLVQIKRDLTEGIKSAGYWLPDIIILDTYFREEDCGSWLADAVNVLYPYRPVCKIICLSSIFAHETQMSSGFYGTPCFPFSQDFLERIQPSYSIQISETA